MKYAVGDMLMRTDTGTNASRVYVSAIKNGKYCIKNINNGEEMWHSAEFIDKKCPWIAVKGVNKKAILIDLLNNL